jgi:hypothetical protein
MLQPVLWLIRQRSGWRALASLARESGVDVELEMMLKLALVQLCWEKKGQ